MIAVDNAHLIVPVARQFHFVMVPYDLDSLRGLQLYDKTAYTARGRTVIGGLLAGKFSRIFPGDMGQVQWEGLYAATVVLSP